MMFSLHAGGFGRRARFDPLYPWVALLVPMEGSNGSTTFADLKSGAAVTTNGNAQISNAQARTPQGTSGLYDGTGDYLSKTLTALGTGQWCMECSLRMTTNATAGFGALAQSSDSLIGPAFYVVGGAGANRMRVGKSTAGQFDDILNPSALSTATWYDVKTLRGAGSSGAEIQLWVDRVMKVNGTTSRTLDATSFVAGRPYYSFDGEYLDGHAAWWRITAGQSRETHVETPPFPSNA
jgi:hypothetical protein